MINIDRKTQGKECFFSYHAVCLCASSFYVMDFGLCFFVILQIELVIGWVFCAFSLAVLTLATLNGSMENKMKPNMFLFVCFKSSVFVI